jgi:hypothetical protein
MGRSHVRGGDLTFVGENTMIIELIAMLELEGKAIRIADLPFRIQARDEALLKLHRIHIHTIKTACHPRPKRWVGYEDSEWPEPVCNLEVVLAALPGRPVTLAKELDLAYNELYSVLKKLESLGKAEKKGRQWHAILTMSTEQSGTDN